MSTLSPASSETAVQAAAEQIDPNTMIHLTLSVDHINKVLKGLGHLPFIEAVDVINAVKGQGDMALSAMRSRNGSVLQEPAGETKRNGSKKH